MKKYLLFVFAMTLLGLTSCHINVNEPEIKSNCALIDGKDDYLIFGTHYGFCAGDCVQLYKLTTSELFADDMKGHFEKPLSFATASLSTDKYAIASALCGTFPLESTNAQDVILGCPDCHDQGTVYIELKRGAVIRTWKIDPDQNAANVPDEIKAYAKLVKDIVDKLK